MNQIQTGKPKGVPRNIKLEGRYFRFDVMVSRLKESGAWDEAFSAPFRIDNREKQ